MQAQAEKLRPQSLRRLLLTYEMAFLTLLVLTGGLAGTWAYLWQQSSAESVRLNLLAHTAQEIRSQIFKQIQAVSVAGLGGDPAARELNSNYVATIQELFNQLRRNSADRGEDYAVQGMQTAFSLLQASLRSALADPLALNRLARSRVLDPTFEQRLVRDFEHAFAAFTGLLDQRLRAHSDSIARRTALAPYALFLPLALGVALLLFSRASLTRGFVRPMQEVMAGLREVSTGNLRHGLPVAGVTEVRELAQGINGMAADLERSRSALLEHERQAALGGLVPVVAHNLRNPLAAIRANAQLIDGAESAQEVGELAHAIIETTDRLGRWITALVSYLHPLTPRREAIPATAVLAAAADLLQPRLAELGVTCARAEWDQRLHIDADRDLLEQALYGLLANAVEASPRGATVTLAVARRGAQAQLTIADRAGGIPFKPEPSGLTPGPTTKRFGTGLGIPIAFKICNSHGFSLDFAIDAGVGTTVVVTAPALPDT